mmetsp:Transcript_22390/g.26985  ORF Transcript_22390/g.26985 Transcript_22390/m.26985 type:complete len:380 (-) Transcript_22390:474-1613(-)|eukprot:CAMPEP_0197856416 /NCGR_PEP_ID=MMETSP1438-20131217/28538_1 /TAXON_ID=1461541 /ORGANISM="Pterosperma sp., Strain CCMP1384" /LENGTH=379 /DNA_ID=CAMNT_0043471863 /DNA_START=243 /DNA_END=1382 /DNA_ORIENTATION=+
MGEEQPVEEVAAPAEEPQTAPKEEEPAPVDYRQLWQYLSKEAQEEFYTLTDTPDDQAKALATALELSGYQGVTREAVQLDFYTYVLTFAAEQKFGAEQTSILFGICYEVFGLIQKASSFADTTSHLQKCVLEVCKIKSEEAGFTQAQLDDLAPLQQAVADAEQELELLRHPPEPETPAKGKPPPEEEIDPEVEAGLVAKVEAAQKEVAKLEDKFKAMNIGFNPIQLQKVTDFMVSTVFTNYKMYTYVFTQEQEHVKQDITVQVESAFPPPPLAEALTTEEMDEYKQKLADEAAAAEAERVRLEEEAAAQKAAEEEAEAQRIKEEEEAELRKRKPKDLDEAVEHAVAMRLLEEKEKLQAEYAAREEQLLEKIKIIEGKLT